MSRALVDADASFTVDETPLVVAALAAQGQIGEAELLLRNQREALEPEHELFAHAHVAMAAANAGKYGIARRHLGRAASLRNGTSDPEALFFLYYGLAHYRFATGRLKLAMMEAHRAGAFLKRSPSDYAAALWHELLGHLQTLTGQTANGASQLALAQRHAGLLGRLDQARSLGLTRVLYEARYQLKPKDAAAKLRAHASMLSPQDGFAKASVQLELCRQHLLRRRIEEARAAFDAAVVASFGARGRRYEATLSLRLVDLLIAAGTYSEALVALQAAEKLLDAEADDVLALEMAARRLAALTRLAEGGAGKTFVPAVRDAKRRLAALERRTGYSRASELKARRRQVDPGLNHRQISLLSDLAERESVDVQVYRRRFDVSEITACRDLAALARGGHLLRVGKARATRYLKPASPAL